MLIVLNGPPAAGKSTLARQYCVDHPLAFALDIDGIRHQLGRWRDQPAEAGLAARAIAVAAARVHLTAGYDVVVPQLLANQGFLDELAAAAAASSAQFVEVMISIARDQSLQRYSDRWRSGRDPVHGAAAAPDLEDVGRTYDRLVAFAATRDVAIPLPAGTSDEMYQSLLSVLQDHVR
jgi:predicted kinase